MKNNAIQEIRAFNRVYTVFIGILNKRYLNSRFSLVETRIMHATRVKPGVTPSAIVSALNIDKSYLSRILVSLEKRKIIKRIQSDSDGRSVKLYITAIGNAAFEKLNAASDKQVEGLFKKLTKKEFVLVVRNLSAIRCILEKYSDMTVFK